MTLFIIIITVIISFIAFNNRAVFARLQFNAYQIYHRKEFHRLLTHGFVHANWWHLLINMFVLYYIGSYVEKIFYQLANEGIINYPVLDYIILYLLSIIFASTISLVRFKDNYLYNSVGASGAVSAIVFFSIFFQPWEKLYLYGIIGIPGIILGIIYLVYSQYMSRKGGDNINHDAHFLGAVFGFVYPLFLDLNLINRFLSELGILN
ncbi:MAG: rhomboid family intramembrane serine protease [Bacteroidales bacterium]|nr:rhomboid family intramembrane serine protease [Bacteroidales bacterium]